MYMHLPNITRKEHLKFLNFSFISYLQSPFSFSAILTGALMETKHENPANNQTSSGFGWRPPLNTFI